MKDLVFTGTNNQVLTTSLLVAEKFGKSHKNVMQAIKEIITLADFSADLFAKSEYPDIYGRMQPMYIMNRDGFSLLVMGFTGKEAINFKFQFIQAFNDMENKLKSMFTIPQTLPEALRFAALQAEQAEALRKQIETDAPKVALATAFEVSKKACLIGELAKILTQNGYEIGQNRLFEWLRDNEYLCKTGESRNQPTQRAVEMKLFKIKKTVLTKEDETKTYCTTMVTPKGQEYFINKFLNCKHISA